MFAVKIFKPKCPVYKIIAKAVFEDACTAYKRMVDAVVGDACGDAHRVAYIYGVVAV